MSVDYLDWALRQKTYSDKLKSAKPVILSHWGDYSYNVSIPGHDSSGHRRIFRFQVENLFCESFSTGLRRMPPKSLNYMPVNGTT